MSAAMNFKQSFSHGSFSSLPEVEKQGLGKVSRLPVSLRIVLESLLRNLDGKRVREMDVKALASWKAKAERTEEIPFIVPRGLLQDFTGVRLVVDLAAMRTAVERAKKPHKLIEPLVPVDLVIDHSVQVDFARVANAIQLNMGIEFTRNRARYEFLKWGMAAFDGLKIVPPGMGIVHQVNLEYLAPGVHARDGVYFPDSLVATGRAKNKVDALRAYFQAQEMFGIPRKGQCDYTQTLELDLKDVRPSVAGPKRPQDRIELPKLKDAFCKILQEPAPNGYGKAKDEVGKRYHQIVEPPPIPHVAGGGNQEAEP